MSNVINTNSQPTMIFCDVALPAALPRVLTYRWSGEEQPPEIGMRVVVPLGNRRLTGVVWEVHDRAPAEYKVKDIEAVVDDRPVVTLDQTSCMSWIAHHYLCSLGDVVSAALPSGMKLASKSRILLNPDIEKLENRSFLERELSNAALSLLDALHMRNGLDLKEVAEVLGVKHPQRIVRELIDKGFAVSEEELKERYKAKKKVFVRISSEVMEEEEVLKAELERSEKRAPLQARALLAYLELAPNGESILKSVLQKRADVNSSVIKKWVEKDVFELEEREVDRISAYKGKIVPLPVLSTSQSRAYSELRESLVNRKPSLLYGVTGSGKTEIYVHLIAETLKAGQQALFLVPEIALTTQLIVRLQKFFGNSVRVYHSRFSSNERTETWMKILDDNKGSLIVGPRSAIFLPFKNLGLIIVDEEHESSYKQQDPAPRYNARDVALWMAQTNKVPLVLGSATPSVETVWHTQKGRITRVNLTERFGGVMMPEILVADLKKEHKQRSMRGGFSKLMRDKIKAALNSNKQVILFQNRRGYSPSWQCDTCGEAVMCERCDIPLTLHKRNNGLHCHHCGYSISPPPKKCGACGSFSITPKGLGTERIEEELSELFPKARVARMDRDTTRSRTAHSRILESFSNHEVDILVGTQMISKGLDFADVALVGVMSADRMLTFPDFRSFERAYQMLTQVAGRSGRSSERGKVVVQTFSPDHWVIQQVVAGDHDKLVNHELLERKNYGYPPYVRLIRISLSYSNEDRVRKGADVLALRLRQRFGDKRVVGPDVPSVAKINDLFRQQLLLKFEREVSPSKYGDILKSDLEDFMTDDRWKRLRIKIDVDPV
ncbi:MAG TPA: primosomal protein N' [Flavobacteriales bacterium]|nr:primosomal protein N' [Flavobacteriales bacterium]